MQIIVTHAQKTMPQSEDHQSEDGGASDILSIDDEEVILTHDYQEDQKDGDESNGDFDDIRGHGERMGEDEPLEIDDDVESAAMLSECMSECLSDAEPQTPQRKSAPDTDDSSSAAHALAKLLGRNKPRLKPALAIVLPSLSFDSYESDSE